MTANESKLRDYLKLTTAELRTVRRRLREVEEGASEPIAIVGMACRFPGGVRSPEDLWDVVESGRDVVTSFPADRGWDLEGVFDPSGSREGTTYCNQGGFLEDVALFDAGFFGISPREATSMDPQQRLFLETCWESLERARIVPESLRGSRTGVYLGATDHDYGSDVRPAPEKLRGNLMIGRSGAVTAGRVSYTLGLEGPALTIDTMCSSSLVALHTAVAALRRGDCDLALTGGTTVMSTPEGFIEFSAQGALSPDGRCRSFGADANGTGWCEGIGTVVLEKLGDARRNGHPVLALVLGGAVNQDGASNGLTAPNGEAQRQVIKQALRDSRVTADEVDLVEAHGTGTTLGDPIEAHALLSTYGQGRQEDGQPLWLGSLKSNLSHSAAAAGIGGVIKTVMALRNRTMPRTLNASPPSPAIDWSTGRVELLHENREWTVHGHPRRAGVSAFGASGTNAHVVLEEAPAAEVDGEEGAPTAVEEEPSTPAVLGRNPSLPLVLSARTEGSLRGQAKRLAEAMKRRPDLSPADVAWSLVTTRTPFELRSVVVGADRAELVEALEALARGDEQEGAVHGRAAAVTAGPVFVFPGQGAQWPGMAGRLAEESPVFAAELRECARALRPWVDWPVHEVLFDRDGHAGGVDVDRVDVIQPALFAVMVSLARTWEACGVAPASVVGHSQGEIAAACVAGVLSLEDAARVVALRSKRIRTITGDGGMLSVALPRARAEELLSSWSGLSVAAVNGTGSVVVSGNADSLDELAAEIEGRGVRTRRVPVDYASHSHHVERIKEGILSDLSGLSPRPARVPLHSTVTGRPVGDDVMDADYWYRNLRGTVELDAAVRGLVEAGHSTFVEVSPHTVLLPGITETLEDEAPSGKFLTVGSLRKEDGGADRFLTSLGSLYAHGESVDWERVLAGSGGTAVDLPTYAFQRQRHWLEAEDTGEAAAPADVGGDFWDIVRSADPKTLAEEIGIDPEASFLDAVPALGRWYERRRTGASVERWRYHQTWNPLSEPVSPRLRGRWLVLVHEHRNTDPIHAEVTDLMRGHGARVEEVVIPAEGTDRSALRTLFKETAEGGVQGIVSLLSLEAGHHPDHPGLPRSVASAFSCIQGFADSGVDAPLWMITTGAVAVSGAEFVTHPEQTAVWGLGRVAALELPDRWGGLVDLPEQGLTETLGSRLVAVLGGTGEDQVALRPAAAYGRRLTRSTVDRGRPRWAPGGTALLTGGTGGVGAQVARWLAELGVPRLVLTSRRGSGAPGAPELERELRALGAEVEITACDAGDATALAHIKERSAKEGFPVRTVFHMAGAGVLRGLADTDVEEFAATTHAKIAGADALDQVFSEPGELDDFVLFSSVSAAWGSGEHGAYACANAYLDGFAEHRRGRGLAARSVVWGIWSPDEGGGMAADLVEEQLRSRGIPFMDPKAALEGFHRVLEGGPVVEVLADVDWGRFAPVFTMARPSPLITTVPEARAALLTEEPKEAEASLGSLADRLVTLSPAQRERELSDLVRTQIAAVLQYTGPDDVDPERALRELGFDSLTAVDLRNRLGGATGLRLPVTIVFDHPDADSLTAHLDGLLVPDPRGDVEAPPGRAPEVGLDDPDEVNDMDIDSLVRLAMQNETDEGVK